MDPGYAGSARRAKKTALAAGFRPARPLDVESAHALAARNRARRDRLGGGSAHRLW